MPIANLMVIDEYFTLMGDEDCGTGLQCRTCNRGGLPVAYYPGIGLFTYEGTDVIVTKSINGLIIAGRTHITRFH